MVSSCCSNTVTATVEWPAPCGDRGLRYRCNLLCFIIKAFAVKLFAEDINITESRMSVFVLRLYPAAQALHFCKHCTCIHRLYCTELLRRDRWLFGYRAIHKGLSLWARGQVTTGASDDGSAGESVEAVGSVVTVRSTSRHREDPHEAFTRSTGGVPLRTSTITSFTEGV